MPMFVRTVARDLMKIGEITVSVFAALFFGVFAVGGLYLIVG